MHIYRHSVLAFNIHRITLIVECPLRGPSARKVKKKIDILYILRQ